MIHALIAVALLAAFRVEDAAPYFTTGTAAEAAQKLRLEEWPAAARGFSDYLKKSPRAKDLKQATFLCAYAELKAGQYNDAVSRFEGLVKGYPLLADYARTWAARAHLAAGRHKNALDLAKQVSASSALDGEARLVRAEALMALARQADSAAEYEGYLKAYPSSWRAGEIRFRRAEVLSAAGRADEARAELKRVYLDSPHESWGREAERRLGAPEVSKLAASEAAARAMILFDNMRNKESELEWTRVLSLPDVTPELTCRARYHAAQSVFKQRDRTRAAPLFDAAAAACEKAGDEDLTTKALYQAGRSWGTRGDKDPANTKKAIEIFEKVAREHAQHSYADDARLRAGELALELKDDAKAVELYSGVPEKFPAGDQRGEALFRLALRAFKRGELDDARKWLDTELRLLPREEGWWEAGRTLYWLARIDVLKGDLERGWMYYRRALAEYPLSYYALQSLSRMRETWPDRVGPVLDDLDKMPADATVARGEGDSFNVKGKLNAIVSNPAFLRGVELVRLGLGSEAKRELVLAGIDAPKKRNTEVSDDEQEQLLWLAATLYDRAGEWALSHFIPRHVITGWSRSWPTGENRRRWLLAYPRGFAELIEKHARMNGQPPALEFAIVREESAFDPLMESFANAVGLTQLTADPAARFAQGLPHDRAALRDPVINVTIGARELGHLWQRTGGNAPLAIAGYNAGEGAVNRWLKDPERAQLPMDAFIESIPYDETRGYTKRVLSSYFTYLWLEGNKEVPYVPLPLKKK